MLHSIDQDLFEHMPSLETLILESNTFLVIDQGSSIAISQIPFLKVIKHVLNSYSLGIDHNCF